jgi:hypothetical protein
MQDEMGRRAERRTERAGPVRGAIGIDGIGLEVPDPVDALLEAHATIVEEIRMRAAQSDVDGSEIVTLAEALAALESVIDVVADQSGQSLYT